MTRRVSPLLPVLVIAVATGCSSKQRTAISPHESPARENREARRILCADIGPERCLDSCPESLAPRAHVECLLELRFGSDPEALTIARALYLEKHTLVGMVTHSFIEGYRGERVPLFPALPLGSHRHHLVWLQAGLDRVDTFVGRLGEHASRTVLFEARPRGFIFFTTGVPSYPSAYCSEDFIGYNVVGPLHTDAREMHETLVHELFHVNDARHGKWSVQVLGVTYAAILERCSGDHACLERYAPHPSVVPDGTFYAFDARTGDVREYAAELALRYFLEHEVILNGERLPAPPFKCLAEENRAAWNELVDAFFGGVDLTPECAVDGKDA